MSNITHNTLKSIISDQLSDQIMPRQYIKRSLEDKLLTMMDNREIIVLTGLRRAGKSVLLNYLRNQYELSNYYFNFEDERLVNFTVEDFQTLLEVFIELYGTENTFFFDEIQNISGWEMFVRRLYNAGNKIYITGSNANLFSEELGTRLTGRYINITVYPVSFFEFLSYTDNNLIKLENLSTNDQSIIRRYFNEYYDLGGIAEYIKYKHKDYLNSLYESILYRDIIVRYKLTSEVMIKKLAFYLASNVSKETSYNALRKVIGAASISTVLNYCNYLENSQICFFINRYSDSLKKQLNSAKKIYFVDHVIAKLIGFRFSEDKGRILENIIFMELKRRNCEIFYYQDKNECDFIARKIDGQIEAIQVCVNMSEDKTKKREIDGLVEALENFSLSEGVIITEYEEEDILITTNDIVYKIKLIPAWKWLIV